MAERVPGGCLRALRFRWLTPVYDPVVRLTSREGRTKRLLAEQVQAGAGRVLELGCGTGTLVVMLARRYPQAEIVGLDADPDVLAIARRKVHAAGVRVRLVQGRAEEPPFAPATFDRVVSSLVFHHLTPEGKQRALDAAHRLLRPGGELHLADWGRPGNRLLRLAFYAVQFLDGFETTRDHVAGRLPEFLRAAGFVEVTATRQVPTMLGTLAFHRARRPA